MSTATTAPATIGNVFEDSLEVLWAPGTVFERAKSRGFGKYLLVLTLISLVITIIAAKLIGPWIDASFDLQMQLAASRGQAVPENAVAAARKFGSIFFYASPLFIVVLGSFVGGLLLMLAGKIVSAPISYGQGVLVAALGPCRAFCRCWFRQFLRSSPMRNRRARCTISPSVRRAFSIRTRSRRSCSSCWAVSTFSTCGSS
jgi:hypothetical protein